MPMVGELKPAQLRTVRTSKGASFFVVPLVFILFSVLSIFYQIFTDDLFFHKGGKNLTGFFLITVAPLVGGIWVFFVLSYEPFNQKRIIESGVEVKGVIKSVSIRRGWKLNYVGYQVEFDLNGKAVTKILESPSEKSMNHILLRRNLEEGQTVRVFYDEKNPDDFIILEATYFSVC